jgi:hypothetical protein
MHAGFLFEGEKNQALSGGLAPIICRFRQNFADSLTIDTPSVRWWRRRVRLEDPPEKHQFFGNLRLLRIRGLHSPMHEASGVLDFRKSSRVRSEADGVVHEGCPGESKIAGLNGQPEFLRVMIQIVERHPRAV